ncbi:MAG: diguanylate cyclase [Candidatus Omnitrophica bacterium]|nr:diguanylate cyclase [Candidatus Omnitrophota bacterium]
MDDHKIRFDQYLVDIIEHLPDPTFVINLEGKVIAWNKAIAEITQVKAEDMLGKGNYEYAIPFYGETRPILIDFAIRKDLNIEGKYDFVKRENDTLIIEVYINRLKPGGIYLWSKASPLYDSNHNIVGSIEIFRDITERKKAEEELRNLTCRQQALLSATPNIIAEVDKNKVYVWLNNAGLEFFGKDVIGKEANYYFEGEQPTYNIVKPIFDGSEDIIYLESWQRRKDGEKRLLAWWCRTLKDKDGFISGALSSALDITDYKKAQEQNEQLNKDLVKSNKKLKKLALCDPQTGLFNYHYLQEIIEAELFRAKRYSHPLSVIIMDIDYFKSINDVYGHQFGDQVLKQLAQLLKSLLRKYDIVIRSGGEEFVILSPGIDRATSLMLANRLLSAINLYNFGDKKQIVKLKLSMAVVSFPEDKISEGKDLIIIADQVLNKVKESGGNSVFTSLDIVKGKAADTGMPKKTVNVEVLEERIEKLTRSSNQSLIEAVFAFAKTIELKDHYTGEHVEKTVHYAVEVARAMGLSQEEIERIHQAAMLHDLGKIGISESILLKPAKLTKKEFAEIKKHPQIAVDIIRPIQFLHSIIPFILYHHERWDGKGYPNGLKADEIPLGARIIAIADVFQALISHRPYRKDAFSKKEAVEIIESAAGTQFDPNIVKVFSRVIRNID